MKRTFTFLFAALFAFVGVWAQLPVTSTAPAKGQWNADTKWYTLKVKDGYVSLHNADGNANLMLNNGTLSKNAQSLWCVVGSEAEGYQFYNLASGTSKVLGATGSDNTGRMTMYDAAGGVDGVTYRFDIKAKDGNKDNAFVKKQGDNNEWWNSRDNYLSYWNHSNGYGDDGSKCIFTEVNLADFVADYKTSAKSALDALGSLFEVADAKAAVDAVTATGVDAFAAVDAAIAAKLPQYVTFRNSDAKEGSVRLNNYLSAYMPDGKGHGTPNFSAQNATWTLKYSGGFCLYNEANEVYLGAPVANGALSKASTAAYTFEVIEGNKVELKANGQTLHLNNHQGNGPVVTSGYFLSNHDGDDPASRWYVESYDYKAELAALIAANEDNHADVPALGQYPTAAYNALVEANETATTIVEVAEAIAAFKAAKNLPVFTIDGVISYAAGKSIYDNPGSVNGKGNTHYFKATNNYDKTMWWALDLTENKIDGPKSSVGIYNVGTGAGFWNASTINITETSPEVADDGIFLFYTTGNDTPIHAQDDGQLICRYGDKGASTGSAWKFTYIGNSYDLGKLTDEHIAALAKLQATYDANEGLKDVTIGTALGQYSGSKDDLVAALDAAKEILAKNIVEVAKMEVSAIEAAEAAVVAGAAKITFNVPVDGKYYRIMAVSGWNDDARYLGSKNSTVKDGRVEFVAEADVNTIFLFQGGYLKNYATDLYLVSNSNFLGYNGEQAAGSKIAFYAASNGLAGAYNISFNEDTRWLYCHTDNYTDAGGRGTQNGYCFNIEEVQETELPALKALCDDFTTKATAFAALNDETAFEALSTIKNEYTPVKTTVDALSAKITANELVLKADVEAAIASMATVTTKVEPVLAYFSGDYKDAADKVKAFFGKLEEGSEAHTALATAIATFEDVAAVTTVAELETKVADVNAVYDVQYAPYDLSKVKEDFATQAEAFAALGVEEAFTVLEDMRNNWSSVNNRMQGLAETIEAGGLVLKSEVEAAMNQMAGYLAVPKAYAAYKIAKADADAAIEALKDAELSEDDQAAYVTLQSTVAMMNEAFPYASSAMDISTYKGMLENAAAPFYDIDTPLEGTGEVEWVDITTGSDAIVNPDLSSLEAPWGGFIWNATNNTDYDAENGVMEFVAGENTEASLIQEACPFVGVYRLTGKAYHKGAVNAVMFVGGKTVEIPAAEELTEISIVFEAEGTVYGPTYTEPDYLNIGYRCEFDNAEDVLVVGGFKLEKEEVKSVTLKDKFVQLLGLDSEDGFVALEYYANEYFKSFAPDYTALMTNAIIPIYEAISGDKNVLKVKMEQAIEDMEAIMAELKPIAEYYKGTFRNTLFDAEDIKAELNEESEAYDALEAAIEAAYDLAQVTTVAELEAKLAAINEALKLVPIHIELNMEEAELNLESLTVQLVATVGAETAEQTVYWESSDEEVATVDENGLVTAVGQGEATITAYTVNNGITAECVVYVDDLTIYPTGVTLNLSVDTLTTAGATVQLEATVAPEDAEDKTITWTTSDEKVATVDADGKVTAVANGTAVITATAVNGVKATCTIVVAIPEDEDNGIESIEVEGNAVIYDIHGRRVTKMEKGLYIVNGKKVLVK